ncbi:MlaD family protein [Myroides odoratimimus]|uniref:MlaD family protein n=1 Tax=Myroides odoratimimus TaxID=76832 RepID=UPI0025775860|nr:MlaD family protein [Myroides odoratimimus]MDM1059794.1 MCE family protein [Myroides odoratimimus]MDM1536483.1 MCE family protein [Myroides odoratimimus]MDM1675962.1 MCE family protein [Myroides odoratimimus]
MKISREIKTAILVLGAIALFIWGYSFLKGRNIFDNSTRFYVEYDNVEGLTTSSTVTINGLVVGKVSKIDLDNTSGKLKVELLMTQKINISKNSVAKIYSPGLLEGKGIMIDPLFGDTNFAESGQTLKGEVVLDMTEKLTKQIEPLQLKVEEALANLNTMLASVNNIMDENTQQSLKSAMTQLDSTLAGANKLMAATNQMVAATQPKLDGTLTNLNTMSSNFASISTDLKALDIKSTFTNLDNATASMDKIMGDIQGGKGSVGKLLKDEQLYSNLEGASKELEALLRDLKEHPKRYVHFSLFGKKATPYQATEEEKTAEVKE